MFLIFSLKNLLKSVKLFLKNLHINTIKTIMADFKTAVCCVCWEKKGSRSMFLLPVNDNISDLIRLYIYDWFDLDLDIHPSVICTNCQRNLYHTRDGNSRAAWGQKIAKVSVQCIQYVQIC